MIKFSSVTKCFSDGSVAFSNLSFEVDQGELVLITGPSGSGKTTIMRLLISDYTPSEGEVFFQEQLLNRLRPRELPFHRRQIGVIFQDYKLIEELNIWENIALPLLIKREKQQVIEDRVTDLLQLVELTEKAPLFPRQLSGGEAQRISIARALANSPKVIFADEPTGNLDQANSQHILQLLTKINKLGTTLLLATHDPGIIDQLKVKRVDLSGQQVSKPTRPSAPPSSVKKKINLADDNDVRAVKKDRQVKLSKRTKDQSAKQEESSIAQPEQSAKPAGASRLQATWSKLASGLLKPKSKITKAVKAKPGQEAGGSNQPIFTKDKINQSFKFNEEAKE